MSNAFLDIAATPAVKAQQSAHGSRQAYARLEGGDPKNTRLDAAEEAFIAARDSFYMATVSASGWPYVQHRGGPAGFLRVLDERTLAFADYSGNKQYISLGNLAGDGRAALILVDYPARRRLKLFVRMKARDLAADSVLADAVATPGYRARPERAFVLHVEAFDWNCPQHITPRFTEAEIAAATAPLVARLEALEAENARLRANRAEDDERNP